MCTEMSASAHGRIDEEILDWAGAPSELQNRGPAFHARTYLISKTLAALKPARLLDIGCGRGYVTRIASKHATQVVATDLSEGAVDATNELLAGHPDGSAYVANALASDWAAPNGQSPRFDVVMLSEVLEHLEDDRSALMAIKQRLVPGGRLLLTVPANPALWTPWDDLAGHYRRYTRVELVEKLQSAGYEVERIKTWGFPISGWFNSKGSRMRAGRLKRTAGESEVPRVVRRLLPIADLAFRVIARLEPLLFSRGDRGSGYVVVAREQRNAAGFVG